MAASPCHWMGPEHFTSPDGSFVIGQIWNVVVTYATGLIGGGGGGGIEAFVLEDSLLGTVLVAKERELVAVLEQGVRTEGARQVERLSTRLERTTDRSVTLATSKTA